MLQPCELRISLYLVVKLRICIFLNLFIELINLEHAPKLIQSISIINQRNKLIQVMGLKCIAHSTYVCSILTQQNIHGSLLVDAPFCLDYLFRFNVCWTLCPFMSGFEFGPRTQSVYVIIESLSYFILFHVYSSFRI